MLERMCPIRKWREDSWTPSSSSHCFAGLHVTEPNLRVAKRRQQWQHIEDVCPLVLSCVFVVLTCNLVVCVCVCVCAHTHVHALSRSVMSNFLWPPWTVAHQAPLSMQFSKQKYWNKLSFPTPRDLPDPGIEPASFASSALAGIFFATEPPGPVF